MVKVDKKFSNFFFKFPRSSKTLWDPSDPLKLFEILDLPTKYFFYPFYSLPPQDTYTFFWILTLVKKIPQKFSFSNSLTQTRHLSDAELKPSRTSFTYITVHVLENETRLSDTSIANQRQLEERGHRRRHSYFLR